MMYASRPKSFCMYIMLSWPTLELTLEDVRRLCVLIHKR